MKGKSASIRVGKIDEYVLWRLGSLFFPGRVQA